MPQSREVGQRRRWLISVLAQMLGLFMCVMGSAIFPSRGVIEAAVGLTFFASGCGLFIFGHRERKRSKPVAGGKIVRRSRRFKLSCVVFLFVAIASWFTFGTLKWYRTSQKMPQVFADLAPRDRLPLVPLNHDLPPVFRVPYWQFVVNPFRNRVNVQILMIMQGWTDSEVMLSDLE